MSFVLEKKGNQYFLKDKRDNTMELVDYESVYTLQRIIEIDKDKVVGMELAKAKLGGMRIEQAPLLTFSSITNYLALKKCNVYGKNKKFEVPEGIQMVKTDACSDEEGLWVLDTMVLPETFVGFY